VSAFLLIQIFIYFSLAKYNKFKQLENNNIEGGRIYEQGKWTRITVGKMDRMKKKIY
jgi:histidinol-phosphate aminotransferase